MKMTKRSLHFLIGLSLSMILVGCSLRAPYPQRQQYMLHVTTPRRMGHQLPLDTLLIPNTEILAPFSDTSFVYRISNLQYINDYYNGLALPPAMNIHQLIIQYLKATQLFQYVEAGDHYLRPHYALTSRVIALYADYRNRNHPTGVISIQFALFKPGRQEPTLLFEHTFTQKIPLAHKDSVSLVRAWNTGLQKILRKLSARLRGITFD